MSAEMLPITFENQAVNAYLWRGRVCWVALDVGRALGYTTEGFQASLARWDEELITGVDLDVLEGDSLSEFKARARQTVERTASEEAGAPQTVETTLSQEAGPRHAVGPRSRAVTILYESGLHVVCLKTEKPTGLRLRRLLAQEVLPKLVRGEPLAPLALAGDVLRDRLAEVGRLADTLAMRLESARPAAPALTREQVEAFVEVLEMASTYLSRYRRRVTEQEGGAFALVLRWLQTEVARHPQVDEDYHEALEECCAELVLWRRLMARDD